MKTTNSILVQSGIFPVYLPPTDEADGVWVNLCAARYITHAPITEPAKTSICWGENDWDEYEGIQAIALIKALESFPFGDYPNE